MDRKRRTICGRPNAAPSLRFDASVPNTSTRPSGDSAEIRLRPFPIAPTGPGARLRADVIPLSRSRTNTFEYPCSLSATRFCALLLNETSVPSRLAAGSSEVAVAF